MEERVDSLDGTAIGYSRIGNGPGLVILHGGLRSADDYKKIAGYLSTSFTVYCIDRRGRGRSGAQGIGHDFQTEREDVAAVLQKTGATFVFGHSFGGLVGLEVALGSYPVTKLAVFEPPVPVTSNVPVRDALRALSSALREKDYGKALEIQFKLVGNESTELPLPLRIAFCYPIISRAIFSTPQGKRLRQLLQAGLAEADLVLEAGGACEKFRGVTVETLLMQGAKSPEWLKPASSQLTTLLPNSALIEIEDVGHSAPCEDAPGQVAGVLKAFFENG